MSESVEQRHAIQKSARPMDQLEYQGIIWVIKADADKRIEELKKVLQAMIDNLEVDLDYRGMNIRSYCPLCGEVSYGEFSSVQELHHQDTCSWVIANRLLSEGGADE